MGSVVSNFIYSYFMRTLETIDNKYVCDDVSDDTNAVGDYYNLYM